MTNGSSLYGFFCSTNDLLGDSTPVEVLAGRVTAKRTLDPEALELVNSLPERRLETVLAAAGAYAADLAASTGCWRPALLAVSRTSFPVLPPGHTG